MPRRKASRNPGLTEVLRAALDQLSSELFVALPGKVQVYNPVTQTADVLPLIGRPFINQDGSDGEDPLPVLSQVPVWFPRGGGYFLSFPLAPGDNVLLVFCDSSMDDYVTGDAAVQTTPLDLRNHDISDCIAIPGMGSLTKVIKDVIAKGAAFGKEKGPQVRAGDSAIEITSGGLPAAVGGFVAMAQLVDAELTKIQTAFTSHTHAGVTPGPGTSGTPAVPPYTKGPVASTNLKAD